MYKMIRPTRTKLALLALALLGGLFFGWKSCSAPKTAEQQTTTLTTATIEESVSAQGKLEPREYVEVGAQVSGQLEAIHAEAGDTVSASELVAEIDPRVYNARLQQAAASVKSLRAQLTEQQSALSLTQKQHARNAQMIESQAVSRQEFDVTAAAVTAAKARVGSVSAQLEQALSSQSEEETNLSYTKIYAPMGGTVISTSVKAGQTINANQQAPTILTIANLATMTVRAQVAEADVTRLKQGMPVTFTTLGSSRNWQGNVRQILLAPEVVNDVVLYNVLVDADNTDGALMPGMSTQITFLINKAENIPTLPTSALGSKVPGQQNTYKIKVKDGKNTQEKQVVIGLQNRTVTEIKSGLTSTDVVILPLPAAGNSQPGGMRRNMGPRL